MNALDLLAVAPHPDDAELLCGGTLALAADRGHRTGILDLTRGELGTRGAVETRRDEAALAATILGLSHREQAGLPDGHLADTSEQRAVVVTVLRRLRPRVLLLPHPRGRHPDHAAASALARSAAFLAGVAKYAPGPDSPFKPSKLVYACAYRDHDPPARFVVDITEAFERKMEAVRAYASQFDGRKEGGELFPSGRGFYETVEVKCAYYGSLIHARYGEPFTTDEPLAVDDVVTLGVTSI